MSDTPASDPPSATNPANPADPLGPQDYNCPQCGVPMQRGEAKAERGLRWYPDGDTGLRHLLGVGGERLISTWQASALGWVCEDCQMALVSFGRRG